MGRAGSLRRGFGLVGPGLGAAMCASVLVAAGNLGRLPGLRVDEEIVRNTFAVLGGGVDIAISAR